jgi:hypothetical protein
VGNPQCIRNFCLIAKVSNHVCLLHGYTYG